MQHRYFHSLGEEIKRGQEQILIAKKQHYASLDLIVIENNESDKDDDDDDESS